MKSPSYTQQKKYENLVEPFHTRFSYFFSFLLRILPDFHTFSVSLSKFTRFSYFFNFFVNICQIFILFQSPFQNLPDFHTFSGSLSKFAKFSYFFDLLLSFARFSYFFSLLVNPPDRKSIKIWQYVLTEGQDLYIISFYVSSEPERAAEARRAVVASVNNHISNGTCSGMVVATVVCIDGR